jgi:molybdate transport system ATP-binding protein
MSEAGLDLKAEQSGPIPLAAELRCEPGEILALVGPSGAGKSTLLRAAAGLVRPTHGRITCAGEVWFDSARKLWVPTRHRRVGFVFQNYALFPHLTALENVMEAAPGPDREAAARHWLARVHLQGLEERRPHRMSGGQQQRVAMARALAGQPKVLLMDEPFSAVDRVTREKLYLELAALLRGLDIPMLLVTHDLDEAAMLASRMVVLAKGHTLQTGTPDEVMGAPRSVAVARLLGSRNILPGVVKAVDPDRGGLLLDWNGLEVAAMAGPGFAVGQRVTWVIAPGDVVFRRPGYPEDRPGHTYVSGHITALLRHGDLVRAVLEGGEATGGPLHFSTSRHLAERGGLAPGSEARLALPAERIRVYAEEPRRSPDR